MNLKELEILIHQQHLTEERQFIFDVAHFSDIHDIDNILLPITDERIIRINSVEAISIHEQYIHLQGATNVFAEYESSPIDIIFFIINNSPQVALRIMYQSEGSGNGTQFSQAYPGLKDSVFDCFDIQDESFLTLSTSSFNNSELSFTVTEGSNFSGVLTPNTDHFDKIAYINDLIQQTLSQINVSGSIDGSKDQPEVDLLFQLPDIDLGYLFNKGIILSATLSLKSKFGTVQGDDEDEPPPILPYRAAYMVLDLKSTVGINNSTIELECTMDSSQSYVITATADFSGQNLTFDDFAKWVGGDSGVLLKGLPSAHSASSLTFSGLNFSINVGSLPPKLLSVTLLFVSTASGELIPNIASVNSLDGSVTVLDPFGTCTISSALEGDLTVGSSGPTMHLNIGYSDNLSFGAALQDGSRVNPIGIIKDLIGVDYDAPNLPSFDVLSFRADHVDSSPQWIFQGGFDDGFEDNYTPNGLEVKAISIQLDNTNELSGSITGVLQFLDTQTRLHGDIDGSFEIKSTLDKTYSAGDIVNYFTGTALPQPSWMKQFDVVNPSLLVKHDGVSNLLIIAAEITYQSIDSHLALGIQNSQGNWAGLVGVDIEGAYSLKDIFPSIPSLFNALQIQRAAIVVSNIAIPNFDIQKSLFPDVAYDTTAYDMIAGAAFFSEFDLSAAPFYFIFKMLGAAATQNSTAFLCMLALSEDFSSIALEFLAQKKFTIVPNVFTITNPDISVSIGSANSAFAMKFKSDAQLTIRDSNIPFTAELDAGEEVEIKFETKQGIQNIFNTHFNVDKLMVGIKFESAGIGPEIEGIFSLTIPGKPTQNIGVLLVFAEAEPVTFVGCYSESLTLNEAAHGFTALNHSSNSILDNISIHTLTLIVSAVKINSDVFKDFRICTGHLPGVEYNPGVFLRSFVTFFGINLNVKCLAVYPDKIQADIEVSPPFKVGKFLSINGYKTTNPKLWLDTTGASSKGFLQYGGQITLTVAGKQIFSVAQMASITKTGLNFKFSFKMVWATVSGGFEFGSDHFKAFAKQTFNFKVLWHKVKGGAYFDVSLSNGRIHVDIYAKIPYLGKITVFSYDSSMEDYVDIPLLDSEDPESWIDEIRKQAEEDLKQQLASGQVSVDDYIQQVKNPPVDPDFDEQFQFVPNEEASDPEAIIALFIHSIMNIKDCGEAAKAIINIHDQPIEPDHLAEHLYICHHPDSDEDHKIYPPHDIIPVLDTVYTDDPGKMNALVGGVILKTILEISTPEEAADILYQHGQLYSKPDIKDSIMSPDSYNCTEDQADNIVDNLS